MGPRQCGIPLRVLNSISHEFSERVRYKVERKKNYSIFTGNHAFLLLLFVI